MDRLHPLEEGRVEMEVVQVPGEEAPGGLGHLLELGVRVGLHEGGQDPAHPVQEHAAVLQRLHRVPEGGRGRVAGDGPDLLALAADPGLEGGEVVLGPDAVEGGHPEGGLPLLEEGIVGVGGGYGHGARGLSGRNRMHRIQAGGAR